MHDFLVNASIQILPIDLDRHPYKWVDEAIEVIRHSGVKYEVGPFATVIEGRYMEIMKVVNAVNQHLVEKGCDEWIATVQFNIRNNSDITGNEKVSKYVI